MRVGSWGRCACVCARAARENTKQRHDPFSKKSKPRTLALIVTSTSTAAMSWIHFYLPPGVSFNNGKSADAEQGVYGSKRIDEKIPPPPFLLCVPNNDGCFR